MSIFRAERDTDVLNLDAVRESSAAEEQELLESIRYCRAYAQRIPVQLVLTGHATVQELVYRLTQPMQQHRMLTATQEVEVNLVAFLLLWRLFLDHTSHDLS